MKTTIDWRLTVRVREAAREDRVIVTPHALGAASFLGLGEDDLLEMLMQGVVLSRRRRDERKTAIDGYKHFLQSVRPSGTRSRSSS